MLDVSLMATSGGRAPGVVVYGGPDTMKTFGLRTLPPPIIMIDLEGGSGNLLPWTRSVTRGGTTTEITDKQRADSLEQTRKSFVDRGREAVWKQFAVPKPMPLIDVLYVDPLDPESYEFVGDILNNMNVERYNSLAIDSLMEFTIVPQSFSKHNFSARSKLKLDPKMLTMQETGSWSPAQERASTLLRIARALRDRGMVVTITSGEFIDKDYVTTPFAQQAGQREEPFSICGGPTAPGRIANEIKHISDIILHARWSGPNVVWTRGRQTITHGSMAVWDTKDRFGRLPDEVPPSYFEILLHIYGKEATMELYNSAYASLEK